MDLQQLTLLIQKCNKCALCKTRTNAVVGSGNISSHIMLIGEGPGYHEDMTGQAFVGPAGQLLDKMLAAIQLDRNQVYICNIVKCRPPENRVPLPEEQEACMDYLREQFIIMRPKLIILLGATASKKILGDDFSITREHGKPITKKGVIFIPTFHPSALLRDASKKVLAWEDLKIAKKIIEANSLRVGSKEKMS